MGYVCRAVDQHGQVIDLYVSLAGISPRRGGRGHHQSTSGAGYVIEELIPAAFHNTGQYENNLGESDHGRPKARLRPMRSSKTGRTASIVIRGHAVVKSLRCGHYELGDETAPVDLLATAFDELSVAI